MHDKQREKERKRSAAQAAERRKKETRRQKMSREWTEEMADFDREIDAKARPKPRNPRRLDTIEGARNMVGGSVADISILSVA